jgi:GNAT superfamily N-acetyltransferase
VLRPIYSVGFRDFVKDRFGLRVKDNFARSEPSGPGAELELAPVDPSKLRGLAVDHWLRRNGAVPRAGRAFEYRLNLAPDQRGAQPIQVGFLIFNEADAPEKTAAWRSADLFVSPPLIGGGIISRFLDATLRRLKADGYAVARVILDDAVAADVRPAPRTAAPRRAPRDPASRQERISTINFYKSRGFVYTKRNRGARTLELTLG